MSDVPKAPPPWSKDEILVLVGLMIDRMAHDSNSMAKLYVIVLAMSTGPLRDFRSEMGTKSGRPYCRFLEDTS